MDERQKTCRICGAEVGEGERYCPACGRLVSFKPRKASASGRSFIFRLAIISIIGFALGAGAAWWNFRPPSDTPSMLTDGSTIPSSASSTNKPPAAAPSSSEMTGPSLEEYAGNWTIKDGDSEAGSPLILKNSGGHIKGTLGPGQDQAVDLVSGEDGRLKGTIAIPGLGTVPLTAELSPDKDKITLVVSPPQKERIVYTAWKDTGEAKPQEEGEVTPKDPGDKNQPAAEIKSMAFGQGLDAAQKIVNPGTVFKPDTPEVFFSVELLGVAEETRVDVTWMYPGSSETVKMPTRRLDDDGSVGFSISKPDQGWTTGRYQAFVYLNGKEAGNASFSIVTR